MESEFEIFGTKRRVFICRYINERAADGCTVISVKYGRSSVMWGCFGKSVVVDLIRIVGIL